jgi:sigma-E factor negative regulatory protein RseA
MVMGEEISRLMDGELDDGMLEVACTRLKHPDGMADWVCYHVIGDALRGTGNLSPGFASRFAARLAEEPTVLAPRAAAARPLAYAWAAAAGVAAAALVVWVAFGTLQTESAVIAKAGEAASIRGAQIAPRTVPADYLLAHQEYSPSTQIQGVGPYLRSVAAPAVDVPR